MQFVVSTPEKKDEELRRVHLKIERFYGTLYVFLFSHPDSLADVIRNVSQWQIGTRFHSK